MLTTGRSLKVLSVTFSFLLTIFSTQLLGLGSTQSPATAIVDEKTVLEIRLSEWVSSKENEAGDDFEAIVDKDVVVNGDIVIPRKSIVFGKLVEVKDSGRVKGRAKLALTLTQVVVRGEKYPLHTNTLEVEADGSKGSDAKKVGGGAGIGGLLGGIFGGAGGLLTGAVIGAGAGTAGVLLTKGKDVEFGPEHRFAFRLEEDLEVSLF